ncbi:DUF4126 domain-containing protein [Salsipaludibacter albus]|uniref:DUF4126 domain-containing protein n=1 Tax=Salsipaludibacter albus TaxID=2849650 RepID=UPI001EE47101|nr:DUF4126 domain-containing protein [Salsipaludibacter albus]MBY5163370.1 DUF4126 domain-containing protein [Salsipaludibacter albus]
MDGGLAALLGTGWASGINLYATVTLLGLLGRFAGLEGVPEAVQSWPVIVIAGAAFLVEAVADKVPYLDNAWDAVHTVLRPLGAAVLGGAIAADSDISTILGVLTTGGAALGAHATKAGTRVAINTSPEPVSNIAVSLFEDGMVAGMIWLVAEYPLVAGIAAVVLLIAGAAILAMAWRVVRAGIRRLRRRGDDGDAGGSIRPPASTPT